MATINGTVVSTTAASVTGEGASIVLERTVTIRQTPRDFIVGIPTSQVKSILAEMDGSELPGAFRRAILAECAVRTTEREARKAAEKAA